MACASLLVQAVWHCFLPTFPAWQFDEHFECRGCRQERKDRAEAIKEIRIDKGHLSLFYAHGANPQRVLTHGSGPSTAKGLFSVYALFTSSDSTILVHTADMVSRPDQYAYTILVPKSHCTNTTSADLRA